MVVANTQTLRAVVVGRRSSVADRLTALGYDVVARVAAGREAIDAARRLAPDAVLFETELPDGLGVLAAQAVTRATPGIAALILSRHPAAAIREARPDWGAVSLMAADAAEAELDADVRDAVARARALAEMPAAQAEVEFEAESVEAPAAALVEIADEEMFDLGAAMIEDELVPITEPEVESDESLIDRAIAAVAERSGLSAGDALRLMEQEADDNGQSLREVALAMVQDEPEA
ncbi:MAG TPA: response regulator [Gemmatimonadaceae bacterium]|jgi:AmiR/NasT family two-component response regulator|nr:response regulator [Gemmatimonadaceae bacterium]